MKKHVASVEFDNNTSEILYARFQRSRKKPAIINFLLKTKVASDEQQAINICLGIVAFFVLVGIVLIVMASHHGTIHTLPVVPVQ